MIIQFERTGGFAGIALQSSIDSEMLEPAAQQALEALIRSSNFFELPVELGGSAGGADRFHYSLTIQDGSKRHTVEMSEEAVPEELQPLIQQVSLLARRFRRR